MVAGGSPGHDQPMHSNSLRRAVAPTLPFRYNQLLAALPRAELERWRPHLELVDLHCGEVLCESGTTPNAVVFPLTAVVSLSYLTKDGDTAEVGVVGCDGVVGVAVFMGGLASPGQAIVQSAGQGLLLNAQLLRKTVTDNSAVLAVLLRYTQSLIVQMAQTAVCNRHHSIEQQFCRRLLMGLDRTPSSEVQMTHEALAQLLGVRREGITAAALRLQGAGVIRYHRGRIEVLDRRQLEQRSCECYAVARKEYQRLMPWNWSSREGMPLEAVRLGTAPVGMSPSEKMSLHMAA
jgi:CRP-like cAMP-binding protein